MRIWSLHPRYLDRRGLVALWREALLAQAVLRGKTKGYRHHPQLERFRERTSPVGAICEYLRAVQAEATERGYRFDASRIGRGRDAGTMTVTRGQLACEWAWLREKVAARDQEWGERLATVRRPRAHPFLRVVPGGAASWEKVREEQ